MDCAGRVCKFTSGDVDTTMTNDISWAHGEIDVALKKGYKIQTIYEVYQTYDSNSDQDGLFTDYINTFLKIKQEASGWPS